MWSALTKAERDQRRGEGQRRYAGRGLCTACYQYLRVNGGLEAFSPDRGIAGVCIRCGGQVAVNLHRLCRDCIEVVTQLQEQDRWSA